MRASGLALLLATAALPYAAADLPNHCLWKQVHGAWTFHMSKASHNKHEKCSKAGNDFGGGDFGLGEPAYETHEKYKVHLSAPNKAVVTDASGKNTHGTWTMIYDEGFEVRADKMKFFAFSKYKKTGGTTTNVCHKTFPGWYHKSDHPDNANWGCYHGTKDDGGEETEVTSSLSLIDLDSHTYEPEEDVVAKINSNPKSTWKAKVYPEFVGKKLSELHSMGGMRPVEHYKKMGSIKHPVELLQEEEDTSDLPK